MKTMSERLRSAQLRGNTPSHEIGLLEEAADLIEELKADLAETQEELLSLLESEGLIPEREKDDD